MSFDVDVINGLDRVVKNHSHQLGQYWLFYGSSLPDSMDSSYEGYFRWPRGFARRELKSYMSKHHPDVQFKIYLGGGRRRWRTGSMRIKFK